LLSTDEANVKIRDGLMDIKVLREVDGAGLERWEPVMKQGFPLSAEDAGRVLEALGISAPPQSDRRTSSTGSSKSSSGRVAPSGKRGSRSGEPGSR
jgi:hypothetical protein